MPHDLCLSMLNGMVWNCKSAIRVFASLGNLTHLVSPGSVLHHLVSHTSLGPT